jgi:hypothetical protein
MQGKVTVFQSKSINFLNSQTAYFKTTIAWKVKYLVNQTNVFFYVTMLWFLLIFSGIAVALQGTQPWAGLSLALWCSTSFPCPFLCARDEDTSYMWHCTLV